MRFAWVRNEHLPADWWEIFPKGIEGVEFVQAGAVAAGNTEWGGMSCERWDAAGNRGRADAAYARILVAMAGEAATAPALALSARFHRNPHACPRSLAAAALAHVQRGKQLYCFADSRRAELREAFSALGVAASFPRAPELAEDLARDRVGVLEYVADWKALLAAREIIAIDGPTSALHPARAAGIGIIYVSATPPQPRCRN